MPFLDEESFLQSKGKHVIFYSVPSSEECKQVRELLLFNGALFTEVDVTRSAFAAQELIRKIGSVATPVVEANGVLVKGVDEKALKKVLSSASAGATQANSAKE